jgi:23S rRNA (adenine2503-C2)-methyltransferase
MEQGAKRDIRALTKDELRDWFVARGEQAFRAQQVYEWLWQKSLKNLMT